jgi:hypothetical protein
MRQGLNLRTQNRRSIQPLGLLDRERVGQCSESVVIDDLVFLSAAYYRVGSVLLRVKPDGKSFESLAQSARLMIGPKWKPGSTGVGDSGARRLSRRIPLHWRNERTRGSDVEFKTGKLVWDRDESWRACSTPQPNVWARLVDHGGWKAIVLGEGGLLGLFR